MIFESQNSMDDALFVIRYMMNITFPLHLHLKSDEEKGKNRARIFRLRYFAQTHQGRHGRRIAFLCANHRFSSKMLALCL